MRATETRLSPKVQWRTGRLDFWDVITDDDGALTRIVDQLLDISRIDLEFVCLLSIGHIEDHLSILSGIQLIASNRSLLGSACIARIHSGERIQSSTYRAAAFLELDVDWLV